MLIFDSLAMALLEENHSISLLTGSFFFALSMFGLAAQVSIIWGIDPFTAQACNISGHGRACKQYIFRSYSTSAFIAMSFDENPFTLQSGKEEKMLKGFTFRSFIGRFQVTSCQ